MDGCDLVVVFLIGVQQLAQRHGAHAVVDAIGAYRLCPGGLQKLQLTAPHLGCCRAVQVYVQGELLGGCDIVLEMQEAGELKMNIEEMMHRMQNAD
jgi:hypothetical protein